ncbi:disintegrin and metalloproteinase domain-containing protein 19 isoform X2 [Prorops nasuta]|uniref:disintegrin and metalloproteinase domain-containing protein 19 isoform X2 n=1 Tax=Prorops nasuta TaxID=863751 RepID=UPI0034CF0B12
MAGDIWCSNIRWVDTSAILQWKLVLLVLLAFVTTAFTSQGASADFSRHSLVRPRIYHGRTKRQISSTRENEVEVDAHTDVLTVGLNVDGEERILDLRLNTDLIPVGYTESHQHEGSYKVHKPTKVELCHYQGSVRDLPGSWVAVSTCRGLRGVIYDGQNLHHVQPVENTLESDHYVYKHNDLVANNTCGYQGTPHHVLGRGQLDRFSRHKRSTETIRGPYNANRQSRYVEMVMVIDRKEYMALDEDLEQVHHHCKDIANIINALFMPLNIFVALIGVQVWSEADEITLSTNGDTTLSNFLQYRRERLVKDIPNDNAQLLTRIQFEGGVVGKALKGPICTYEFSGGVSMDHSNVIGLVAATVAHELGHNFGMEHDSPDCECPEEKCIMASSSGSYGPTHWSTCSLEHLALAFEHGMDYCLRNKPKRLFNSPICGNGFVEPGEQCDCGLKENCDNPCCNATTCMLHANASCATGECCDLKTCKPKTAGTECRSAEHECDLPEYCTGQSEYCPSDVFKMDGETCSMGKAFCYKGSCRTHNDQCKLLWGPTGSSSDPQCYDMNNKGNKLGNCGYNRIDSQYVRCNNQNVLCGMLHCKHLNERLEFGMESVAILSHSFINNGGKIIPCRSAIVDFGLTEVDPGLAPDGAKCAPGKMCVNQKCMAVADLRASVSRGKGCPNNCNNNGVCNSLGHCHCNRGFSPPDCTQPGIGGSEDSGPVEDPNARHDVITAMYVIFLGIVPIVALMSFGVWYMRNTEPHWKKSVSTNDRGHGGLPIKTIDRSQPSGRNIETIDSSLSQDPACASLLPKADEDERFNNNLFGQFKGFTITPIHGSQSKVAAEPSKPAPPPPSAPIVAIKTNLRPVQKASVLRSNVLSVGSVDGGTLGRPTLPPLNPGSTARPLISSPVLAATTCTSVEVVGPKVPSRPAPLPPSSSSSSSSLSSTLPKPPRPTSTPPVANAILPEMEKKPEKSSTLNRIASILRPTSGIIRSASLLPTKEEKNNTNSLPRSQHLKANKVLDKEMLRSLEISGPILQSEIEIPSPVIPVIPDGEPEKRNATVLRAQSMRDSKVTPRPAIHTFGSMRQAAAPVKRPTSIPSSARPTSPPPPVPPPISTERSETLAKIPGLPGYQNPPLKTIPSDNVYDDCMNLACETPLAKITEESPTSDNIYAVIEETLPEKVRNAFTDTQKQCDNEYKLPKKIENVENSSLDTAGLLSEIVSEISNRNFDSIYSASTLSRKKKKDKEDDCRKGTSSSGSNSSLGTYANSSSHYKSPGSIYSNTTQGSNPNVNDEMSKELGMKPVEPSYKSPVASNAPVALSSTSKKKEEKRIEAKAKPPLNRTKTPPNISKSSGDKTPTKSQPTSRQNSDVGLGRQNSDSSLKSKEGSLKRSGSNASKSRESQSTVSLKSVPCSPKDNSDKLNSPDLVSSCSAANQSSTKSPPDVLGSTPKFVGKTQPVQKTTTMLPRETKPQKPPSLTTSKASLPEKKKSPSANVSLTKSLASAKEADSKALQPTKLSPKSESGAVQSGKSTYVQKAASGKSNVASLQQKFEANKYSTPKNTIVKKPIVGKLSETQLKK